MPERNIPPDWYLTLFGLFWTGLAGSFGAVLRQITGPRQSWLKRFSEWIGGAICAVYMTPMLTHILLHLFDKFDLIDEGGGFVGAKHNRPCRPYVRCLGHYFD